MTAEQPRPEQEPARPRRHDLIGGPIGSTITRLAVPMAFGMAAVVLFTVVDTIYVGRLGATELAAMSFTFPVTYLVMSVAMGLGIGASAVISQAIGRGDERRVRRLTTDALVIALLTVFVVAGIGLLTLRSLFTALGAGPTTIDLIRAYMVPWYWGVGLLVIPLVGNAAIRATGDTKTPSVVMVIAGVVNIALDPVLIFGLGPVPRMGIAGAAYATVISWAITFVAALWILGRRERMLSPRLPGFTELRASWGAILHVGLPAAATRTLLPLAAAIVTRIVSAHGDAAVASFGAGTRVEAFAIIGMISLAAGMTPFVGQNLGADRLDRIRDGLWFSGRTSVVLGLGATVVLAALSVPIAAAFSPDEAVRSGIVRYLLILPISYGAWGIGMISNATLNAMSRPLLATTMMVILLGVLTIPLAWLGSRLAGTTGVFAGLSIANLMTGVVAFIFVRLGLASATRAPDPAT